MNLFENNIESDYISIDISSTPYSIKEAKFLSNQKNIPFIKIASMEINNYRYLEPYTMVGVIFLILSVPAAMWVRKLERKVNVAQGKIKQ